MEHIQRAFRNTEAVPAIVLGGSQNALSVARSLSRNGIPVLAINYPHEAIRFSRCANYLFSAGPDPIAWEHFLVSNASEHLRGSIIFACSDEAISLLGRHDSLLRSKFLLEETSAAIRRDLLNKHLSYRRAIEAAVPTVRYCLMKPTDRLESALSQLTFPLILKPVYSPDSQSIKIKAAVIHNLDQLSSECRIASAKNVDLVLMDYIPGGDDRLCSYFTYLDEHANPLVHLTKRVRRRYPENGDGTYHYTEWIPEVAALGLKFFRSINYRGLGNVEFKWDERDKTFKMIEANARFAASDRLLAKSGVNLALIAYNRILNRVQRPVLAYKKPLVLWRPIEDTCAAWTLNRRGELRLVDWLNQIVSARIFPFFELRDPFPALMTIVHRLRKAFSR
jgi:predicted ATP-grasp superfamily ATP-dependent carboligase